MTRSLLSTAVFCQVLAISYPVNASAPGLYGFTPPVGGQSKFLLINTTSGRATPLFSFPLSNDFAPRSMAFDPGSSQFLILGRGVSGNAPAIASLNPFTHAVTYTAITGLPAGQQNVNGIEYDRNLASLLITFGPTGTFFQKQIASVSADGVVQQVSPVLNLPDCDNLAFDPSTSRLMIVDLNDSGVLAIADVFGSPTLTLIAPNPNDDRFVSDPAFTDTGQLFSVHTVHGDLQVLSGSTFVPVGPTGITGDISGMAFGVGPETPNLSAARLYGFTQPVGGQSTLLEINTTSGLATPLFSFPLSNSFTSVSMAFDPRSSQFLIVGRGVSGNAPAIASLNPFTHAVTYTAITGLPAGQQNVGGIEYDRNLASLLITFGPTGTFFQKQIASVSANGVVQQVSPVLNLPDCDNLAFDPSTGRLMIVDLNDSGVLAIADVFGSPTLTLIAPNPNDDSFVSDPASTDTGQLFSIHAAPRALWVLSGSTFVPVGPTGIPDDINGLAFGLLCSAQSVADLDADCDVDADDFVLFKACVSGSAVPLTPGCENRDFDHDGDVDMDDFAVLQRCYGGAGRVPDQNCAN